MWFEYTSSYLNEDNQYHLLFQFGVSLLEFLHYTTSFFFLLSFLLTISKNLNIFLLSWCTYVIWTALWFGTIIPISFLLREVFWQLYCPINFFLWEKSIDLEKCFDWIYKILWGKVFRFLPIWQEKRIVWAENSNRGGCAYFFTIPPIKWRAMRQSKCAPSRATTAVKTVP